MRIAIYRTAEARDQNHCYITPIGECTEEIRSKVVSHCDVERVLRHLNHYR